MTTESFTILTDPLPNDYGPGRVAVLLGRYLVRHRPVTVVAPWIAPGVEKRLAGYGMQAVDLGLRARAEESSLAFFETWLREAVLGTQGTAWASRSADDIRTINLSNTIPAPAAAWYLLGSVSEAIADLAPSLPPHLRMGVALSTPLVRRFDARQIAGFARRSRLHVASSSTCGDAYAKWGVRVDAVIYPPVDTDLFRPATAAPADDYCLSYLGKETDFGPLLALADAGVPILAFGSKFRSVPERFLSHPKVRLAGAIGDADLARLYSGAKFTAFPFTTEPFGYIPIESMACGTPVLTYDEQGPSETVVQGETGWRVPSPGEFVSEGLRIWRGPRIEPATRSACRDRAMDFSFERAGEQWLRLVDGTSAA